MEKLYRKVVAFIKDEEGLTTVEYAIAGGLVGLAVVGGFKALGDQVGVVIGDITDCLKDPTTC